MLISGSALNRTDLERLQAALLPAGERLPFDRGRTWAWREAGALVGYAALLPVPGLPGLSTLHGGVLPSWRRQGIGRRLLAAARAALPAGGRLECATDGVEGPAAAFLRGAGFGRGHEEVFLRRSLVEPLPALVTPAGWRVITHSPPRAAALLRRLYDESFAAHPWHQPFATDDEVSAELDDPANLLFGLMAGQPVAFAWIRPADRPPAIEPFGVIPAGQGQGLGVLMLGAALARLRDRGVVTVAIGAWRSNGRALHLYRRFGFDDWYGRQYWVWPAA